LIFQRVAQAFHFDVSLCADLFDLHLDHFQIALQLVLKFAFQFVQPFFDDFLHA